MAITEEQKYFLIHTYRYYLISDKIDKIAQNTLERFFESFGFVITSSTLYNVLKKEKIQTMGHGGKRNGFSNEEFIALYNSCDGDAEKLLKATDYCLNGLIKKCRDCSLNADKIQGYKKAHSRQIRCKVESSYYER